MSSPIATARQTIVTPFSFDTGIHRLELDDLLTGVDVKCKDFRKMYAAYVSEGKGDNKLKVLVVGDEGENMEGVLGHMRIANTPKVIPVRTALALVQKGRMQDCKHVNIEGMQNCFIFKGAGGRISLVRVGINGECHLSRENYSSKTKFEPGQRIFWMP